MTEVSVRKKVPSEIVALREKVISRRASGMHRRMPGELRKLVNARKSSAKPVPSKVRFVQIFAAKSSSAVSTRVRYAGRTAVVSGLKMGMCTWHRR